MKVCSLSFWKIAVVFLIYTVPCVNYFAYAGDYSARPDILSSEVKATLHKRDTTWEKLKESHVEAIAEILAMYPDRQIFFLARDGELLYDLARVMTHDLEQKEDSNRIHLINVSRLNMNDPHLKDYLEQEGIHEGDLKKGKKVLLVDTGFAGSIPATISNLYPEEVRGNLQTQLLCSSNSAHPSSRAFLYNLNPAVTDIHPSQMHGTIISYEHRARYTHRSNKYVKNDKGKWLPYHPDDGTSDDGAVSTEEALKDMEDMKAYSKTDPAKKLYEKRLGFWKEFRTHLEKKDTQKISDQIKALLETKDPKAQSIVRDAYDIARKNEPTLAEALPKLETFGMEENSDTQSFGNKLKLIAKHPEWKPYLEDPKTGIDLLLKNKDYQTLRAIADVIEDEEFSQILAKKLGEPYPDSKDQEEIRNTVNGIIEQGKPGMLPITC